MNGRVQDSITGRFLSPDPTVPDRTDPQSYNRYSYARNNPLTRIDPSGFDDYKDYVDANAANGNGTASWGGTVVVPGSTPAPPSFSTAASMLSVIGTSGATYANNLYDIETVPIIGHTVKPIKPKAPPPPQKIPCLQGVDCILPQPPQEVPCGGDCTQTVHTPRPHPYNPKSCMKAGIDCDPTIPPELPCFTSFLFSGQEVDLGGGGAFAGTMSEYNWSTGEVDLSSLAEAWLGEGAMVGAAGSQSLMNGRGGGFTFVGFNASAGPLAGGQVGEYLETDGIGVFAEGHGGPGAGGAGIGITLCH
jgi:hypothetical protein